MLQCTTGQTPDDSLPLTAELHSFFQLFSECLGIGCVSLEELQHWCSGDEVGHESTMQHVYFRMLNMPGKKRTSVDRWKETAVKFGAAQSVVPSQARYDELSYRQRALILKRLCEWHLDNNEKLRAEVKKLGPAALRQTHPVGTDMQGNRLWMLEDHTSQAILFVEHPYEGVLSGENTQCTMVARNLDEVAVVLEHLKAQMEQRLHDKPLEVALTKNKHSKTTPSKHGCLMRAENVKRGDKVCTSHLCCGRSRTECTHRAGHADRWTCPADSLSQHELLISSLQERLELLVPKHQMYRQTKAKTERELKRLSFLGRGRCLNTVEFYQSFDCGQKEIRHSKRKAASKLSLAEEKHHTFYHSSSSEEQSIESGEEEAGVRLTRRGQRYQNLLEKRKKAWPAEKENMCK